MIRILKIMIFLKVDKSHILFNSKTWKIKKKIKNLKNWDFSKREKFPKRLPPILRKSICINNLLTFLLKVKGIDIYLEILKNVISNYFKIFSTVKNIFPSSLQENNQNLEFLFYYLEKNQWIGNINENKNFLIIKQPLFSKIEFLSLNSGNIYSDEINFKKNSKPKNYKEKIILSIW